MHISPYPNSIGFQDIPYLTTILAPKRQVEMLEERFNFKFVSKPSETQRMCAIQNSEKKGAFFIVGYGLVPFQTKQGKEYFFDKIQKIGESDIKGEGSANNIIIEIKNKIYLYRAIKGDFRFLEWVPNTLGEQNHFSSYGEAILGMRAYIQSLQIHAIVNNSGRNIQ